MTTRSTGAGEALVEEDFHLETSFFELEKLQV